MNNALVAIGSLAIAILATLFAVPHFVDWTAYRDVFEEQASRMLGRDVRVSGDVNLHFLPTPFVRFERIRIGDGQGDSSERLFRADDFTLWLSIPPLLQGVFEAREITLSKPVLRLTVDEDGQGNWRAGSGSASQPVFMPAGLTLQSVKIEKGALVLAKSGGDMLARFDNIDGVLSADALDGPFKFNGSARWDNLTRDVRFATAQVEPGGGLRVKAAVHAAETGSDYVFDGRLDSIMSEPRVSGSFSAKVPLSGAEAPPVDLRAVIEGDARRIAMNDITVSFDSVGQPQLITGKALAGWETSSRLDLELKSRWLDLDGLAGTGTAAQAPLAAAQSLVQRLVAALPKTAETRVALGIDQAALGGDQASNLDILVSRADGPLRLDRLNAELPGNARLNATGDFKVEGEQTSFSGPVAIRGSSLARFMSWAVKASLPDDARADGAFFVDGAFEAKPGSVSFTKAAAEIAGMPLDGSIKYQAGEQGQLDLVLRGRRLDAAQLWPSISPGDVTRLFTQPGDGVPKLSLDVRLAELAVSGSVLRDFQAVVSVDAEALRVAAFRFTDDNEFALEVDGTLTKLRQSPAGTLNTIVSAPSVRSLAILDQLAEGNPALDGWRRLAPGLIPLKLAGSLVLGARGAASADVLLDGAAGGGRLSSYARFNDGVERWRDGRVEARIALDGVDVERVAASLSDKSAASSSAPSSGGSPQPGRLSLAVSGVPSRGLAFDAFADGTGRAAFNGQLVMGRESKPSTYRGRLDLDASPTGLLLSAIGIEAPAGLAALPVTGRVDLDKRGTALSLAPVKLSSQGATIGGRIDVDLAAPSAPAVRANLTMPDASVAGLLAVLSGNPARQGDVDVGRATVWPEAPFDFSLLDQVGGTFALRIGRLDAGAGLAVDRVLLEAELSPGKVAVGKLNGSIYQAQLGSALSLEKIAAGVAFKGAVNIAELPLAGLSRERPANGEVSVELAFEGQALNPAALMASLKGSGNVALSNAKIKGLAPENASEIADGVLIGRVAPKGDALTQALADANTSGDLDLGTRTIPVDIVDGSARVAAFTLESDKGRATGQATIDFSSMRFDSEWRIEPKPSGASPKPLPAIGIVHVGRLGDVAAAEPRITSDAFERELNVRRLEQDVGELERLRQQDDQRRQAEEARQRALDEERQRALEADRGQAIAEPPAATPVEPPVADPPQSGWAAAPQNTDPNAVTAEPLPPAARTTPDAARASPPRPPARKPKQQFDPFGQL